tara:strand:- start:24937 stop:25155 length:219 start_codon:yes stop_codon:yes gene_type:complete
LADASHSTANRSLAILYDDMALGFRNIVQELKNAKKSSDGTVIIECAERVEKLRCRLAAIPPRRQGTTGGVL